MSPDTDGPRIGNGNPPVYIGNPELSDDDCTIAVTRYLARSIEMNFLANFNYPSPCYGYLDPVTHQPLIDSVTGQPTIPPNNATVNCSEPYNNGESYYCPDKYIQMINSLVAMNAQFIRGVYGGAGFREDMFFPGEAWYCLGPQIVRDINYAYDCAGLKRPVIQSNVSELVNLDRFKYMNPCDADGWKTDGVNRQIPPAVIDYYFCKFPNDKSLPDLDPGSLPNTTYGDYYSTTRYFRVDRITDNATATGKEDITKVEMRMWFLYQAMTLIDFGYTAIHMGIYWIYAEKERMGNPNNLLPYHNLDLLTTAIRDYATSCGPAHFVLLSGETPGPNVEGGLSAKAGGTDRFIFDFDSRAMRPREIAMVDKFNPATGTIQSLPVAGDNDCEDPISQSVIDAFNNSPCGLEPTKTWMPAVVDPCVISRFGGVSGGTSPLGCTYDQIPYVIHYDGFSGTDGTGGSPSNSDPYHLSTLTWGFDDHSWFEQLSQECKEWWFDYFYCNTRNFDNGVGFMAVPGVIAAYPVSGHPHARKWLLTDPDHASFVNSINTGAFAVKPPTLTIREHCTTPNGCATACGTESPPPSTLYQPAGKYYIIEVGNKDCSSVYSLYIKDAAGNQLYQVIGSQTTFRVPADGTYQVTVRQDNLGLPPSTSGIYEQTIFKNMQSQCCQTVSARDCQPYLTYFAGCVSIINDVYTYNVTIEATDNVSAIRNIEALSNSKILSIQYINPYKVIVLYATHGASPQLDILLTVVRDGSTLQTLLNGNLSVCPDIQTRPLSTIDLKVFPNPVEHMLQVEMVSSTTTQAKMVVFNSISAVQVVKEVDLTAGGNNFSLDMSDLPAGFYSILVHTPETSTNAKFIKIKR